MGSSIRRTDILALSNLREDGRKPEEIRRMRIQMGPVSSSSGACGGSAVVEMGLTQVLATARGPISCTRRSDERPDRAIVEVSIKLAPFAPSGGDRRIVNPNSDRRLIEMSHLIKRALEATLLLHLFPKSKIEIAITTLADDGSALCVAINAASMALVDAGIPMKDLLCACSAGYSVGLGSSTDMTLVDLNRREESSSGGRPAVNLPCAMLPQRGTIVLTQCEARLPNFDTLERVLDAAMNGCRAVFDVLQAAVRERATLLLSARSGHGTSISIAYTKEDQDEEENEMDLDG